MEQLVAIGTTAPSAVSIRPLAMFLEVVIVDGHFCPQVQFLAAP